MCVPFTGSKAWTSSLGYKVVDGWRPWISKGQVAGYVMYLSQCTDLESFWHDSMQHCVSEVKNLNATNYIAMTH